MLEASPGNVLWVETLSKQLRNLAVLAAAAVLAVALALLPAMAWADAWDPPAAYYSGATGTGATLKSQLSSAMSAGHIERTYGDYRFSAAITDQDPNNPSNILLVYNRASVPATWDAGDTWNREHVWPVSRQPGSSPSASTQGNRGDPHALRPADPFINGSRGNKPFAHETTTGSHGHVDGTYYFPGDADKGDIARQLFYSDIRYGATLGLSLVDTVPAGNQMGDLSSLLVWHFLDPPDEFERRRNHTIYSQAYNPDYYTNNRSATVDHPEFVWSIYVDQFNDSQITIDGGTDVGSGGSTRDVDLGRVFVGGAVPAAQNFTLNKAGLDGTYYEVTAAGDATSSLSGRFNAFRTNGTDSESITVGLNTGISTASAGLKSGTVTVDNLDVTTGVAGSGANDGNDVFNVSLDVLDHATPSFDGMSQMTSLMVDFGAVALGAVDPIFNFDLFNLESTLGFTADLDFDSLMTSGDTGVLSADLAAAAGSLSLDGGDSQGFTVTFDTASLGTFSATYTLMVSDEDLAGALSDELTLTVMGQIVGGGPLLGDYNGNDAIDAADYTVWRDALEAAETDLLNDPTPGTVDESDFTYWRDHFGETAGSGAGAGSAAAVPEPSAFLSLAIGGLWGASLGIRRRFQH